eukprot:TRINITY_DN3170_c0_g1_i2.p1 TRINITY_DN3170_c0_g1~~TRINITY_DN3170_c0_g1_i2.p1  ORF type:complete len:344 (-),score=83.11 TRINITY_DN3170_c0_g1_i2:51-1082(-)
MNLKDEALVGQDLGIYKIEKYLERGAFGDVHLAKNTETEEQVVIKIVDKRKAIGSQRKKAVLDELNVLKVLHPAIIELKDFFVTKDYLVLVMEYCAGGDLFGLVVQENGIPEERCKPIFKQILEGLEYLHKLNIIHRDIKLENILLKDKETDTIKITDFGMSRIVSRVHLATTQCGTTEYTAPEVFGAKPYGYECDCWSLGILLYDMLSTDTPFQNIDQIMASEHTGVEFKQEKWKDISENAKDLIRNLLCFDPDKRYTIQQALNSKWFQSDYASPQTYVSPKLSSISKPIVEKEKKDSNEEIAPAQSPSLLSSPHGKKRSYPTPQFGMSLRKHIKVKHPIDV